MRSFLRLFGHHRNVKDAHRAGANRLRNKQTRELGLPYNTVGHAVKVPQCNCAVKGVLPRKWKNGRCAMGKKYRHKLGGIQATLHSWWKKSVACLLRKVDDHVKHAFRKQNREADHLANLGKEGKWKITIEGVENM